MAIQKSKILDNGATGNYWKINAVTITKNSMNIYFGLVLYADKDHGDSGSPGLLLKDFNFPITKDQLSGDIVALGYTSIKAMNPEDSDLAGGVDV